MTKLHVYILTRIYSCAFCSFCSAFMPFGLKLRVSELITLSSVCLKATWDIAWGDKVLYFYSSTHIWRDSFQMKQQLLVLCQSLVAYLTAGPRMVQSAARPAEEDQPWCPPICSAGSTCMLECCHRLHVLHWVQVDVSVYPVTLSTASSSFSSLSSSSSPSPSPAWNSAQLSNALWPGQLQDGAPWGTAAVGVYCCWSVSVELMTMHPHTPKQKHTRTQPFVSLSHWVHIALSCSHLIVECLDH